MGQKAPTFSQGNDWTFRLASRVEEWCVEWCVINVEYHMTHITFTGAVALAVNAVVLLVLC